MRIYIRVLVFKIQGMLNCRICFVGAKIDVRELCYRRCTIFPVMVREVVIVKASNVGATGLQSRRADFEESGWTMAERSSSNTLKWQLLAVLLLIHLNRTLEYHSWQQLM